LPVINENLRVYEDYYNKPSWWFKLRWDTQVKKKTCLHLVKKIPVKWQGKTIVELGFGSGDVIFSFPNDNTLIGAEISKSAIENANRRAENRGVQTFDFYSVADFPDLTQKVSNVDLVIASHVLEHVDDDWELLRQVYDALKPHGYFVAVVPVEETYKDPNHARRYDEAGFFKICERAGFKCIDALKNGELFSLVEPIYWKRLSSNRTRLSHELLWKGFNLLFCWWPYNALLAMDKTLKNAFGRKPHQLAALFRKHSRPVHRAV